MSNKIDLYNELQFGISVELEFASLHSNYLLIETISEELNIDIEAISGAIDVKLDKRSIWVRESSKRLKINNELRREIQTAFSTDRNIFTHKIISPVLKTKKDLITLQKLFILLSNKRFIDQTSLALISEDTLNISFKIHTKTKIVSERTLCYIIGRELKTLYKEDSNLKVFLDGNIIEFNEFNSLTTWYEIRNTIFLLEECSETIIKSEEV